MKVDGGVGFELDKAATAASSWCTSVECSSLLATSSSRRTRVDWAALRKSLASAPTPVRCSRPSRSTTLASGYGMAAA